MYCLGSRDFEVAQTALRNLPEYTLLCQGESAPTPPTQAPVPPEASVPGAGLSGKDQRLHF